jgi:hypothetical protein
MAELVPVTRREIRKIKTTLRKQEQVVCLDSVAYVKTPLVGQGMLVSGEEVKAKIVKGYGDSR